MSAYATCKFPMVDRFKEYGEKNCFVGFIDSVLSGFAQIVLSDNPVTGLLIMLGVFFGAPAQLVTALWAACIASAFAFLIGVNKDAVRHGLYTFSAAIVGLGVSLWGYSNQAVYPQLLIYAGIGAIVSVIVTAAINVFLSKWEAPSLSVPYCVTLMMIIPALFLMSHMKPQLSLAPQTAQLTEAFHGMDLSTFMKASISGVGEICFQVELISGICLLLALLVSSRIDAIVALICAALGTGLAATLGLPTDNIVIGLYGYNAALVGMGLFGRAFRMSVPCALFTIVMALFSVLLTAGMGVAFMPLGIPVAALPFGVIVIFCMIGKDNLRKLTPVSMLLWGVPETIEKTLQSKEASDPIQLENA